MKAHLHGQWHYQSIVFAAKRYLSRVWNLNLLMMMISLSAFADGGSIKVLVTEKATKEPIPFANVVVYLDKKQVAAGTSDIDGYCLIKPLEPGKYNVKAIYVGYQPAQVNDVSVSADKTTYITISLQSGGVELKEVVVAEYSSGLIDAD
ncbi:MAG TPA: carboxypeptidase-like regulatory domain-containing protein, partial [Bacteroidia bacterium]|nr:carboxypeptidase-like regulatory domain-containing protein [Bacteroidia bacterium]